MTEDMSERENAEKKETVNQSERMPVFSREQSSKSPPLSDIKILSNFLEKMKN